MSLGATGGFVAALMSPSGMGEARRLPGEGLSVFEVVNRDKIAQFVLFPAGGGDDLDAVAH